MKTLLALLALIPFFSGGAASAGDYETYNPFEYKPWSGSGLVRDAASRAGLPAWENGTAERRRWTEAVRTIVDRRLADFDRARDAGVFCPGYQRASRAQRVNCWVLLVAAVSSFETGNFNPAVSFVEPNGQSSIGMLALSPGECPNAPTARSLMAPVPNLVCGVNRMAFLIARTGWVDGPAQLEPERGEGRGASRYWSTLREPYRRWHPAKKRWMNLGKKPLIRAMIRGYRSGEE